MAGLLVDIRNLGQKCDDCEKKLKSLGSRVSDLFSMRNLLKRLKKLYFDIEYKRLDVTLGDQDYKKVIKTQS